MQEFIEQLASQNKMLAGLPRILRSYSISKVLTNERQLSFFGALEKKGEKFAVHQMLHFLLYPADAAMAGVALCIDDAQSIRAEYSLDLGRADLMVRHIDQSVTAIEVKDGGAGFMSVLAGIGQVASYACQLEDEFNGIGPVRKALAWTACRRPAHNAMIARACIASGVLPVKLTPQHALQDMFDDMVLDVYQAEAKEIKERLAPLYD